MTSQFLTQQERAQFIELGKERYATLRVELERAHMGDYVAIGVKSGRHIATNDDTELKIFRDSLGPGDFFWVSRVGSI